MALGRFVIVNKSKKLQKDVAVHETCSPVTQKDSPNEDIC
jgi:hypothetical protein